MLKWLLILKLFQMASTTILQILVEHWHLKCPLTMFHIDDSCPKLDFLLFSEPTDETKIKNIINKLKEGAPGRDGTSSKNIKLIEDYISYPLANMVNLSFEQGVFPDEIKICCHNTSAQS